MPFTAANIRYHIDDLTLNIQLGTLFRAEQEIPLPQLSYRLLCILVQKAPAIVTQDELMALVWTDQVVSDETLKQRIKLLRQAIDDTPQTPKYIASVRGRGYRCVASVRKERLAEKIPHDSINLKLNDRLPVSFMRSSQQYWRMVAVFFLLVISVSVTVITLSSFYGQRSVDIEQISQDQLLSPSAQHAYHKGREFYLRYQSLDNEMAIKSYLRAIELAPNYALAYAGLADAYSQGVFQFSADSSWQKKALAAAYDAIMLDDQLAQSYKSLGTAHYVNGHIAQSLSANLKAVALDPTFIEAQANLGYIYSERGQLKNAQERHHKVYQLDPSHQVNWFHMALTSERQGDLAKAIPWYQKVLKARPSYHLATFHYSRLLQQMGDKAGALALLSQAEKQTPDSLNVLKGLADVYLLDQQVDLAKPWIHKLKLLSSGETHEYATLLSMLCNDIDNDVQIQQWYDKRVGDYNERPFNNVQLAIAATALNDTDGAFRHLTQAIELGWLDSYYLQQLPFLASLRQHNKFQRILQLIERNRG